MMQLDPNHAMVIFSGGQDSTTCLGWALQRYGKVSCVSFNYGQKHAIELMAASDVIRHFESQLQRSIFQEIIMLGDGIFAGTSPLTNKDEALETYENHDQMEQVIGDRVEKTFVPMRNAAFLMIAANRAVVAGAGRLVTGVCEADNANYPDCRASFINATEVSINQALGIPYRSNEALLIDTPLIDKSKAQSIRLALSLPHTYAALAWSHTAYNGEYPPTGRDHASVLRAHGFEEADVPDPLVLRAYRDGLMMLPATPNYRDEKIEWAGDYLNFLVDEPVV